ncbi:MAG: hypothetical protein KC776_29110 [Myxococcales bacterium]|nr:hypothetical protein [Myxococcales bacterium]MCB9580913.1 glycosidase [Polyangiaceae bacterium]
MAGTAGSGGSGGSGGSAGSGSGGAAGSGGSAGAGAPAPMVGVYVGNDPAEVTKFEAWLGRDVDGVLGYTGAASWADFDGSVGWAAGLWAPLDRRVFWSVPLIPAGASLASAAAGDYDDHYKQAAQKLAGFRPGDPKLFVRTGWELNGDWFPWAAQGKEQDFIGAFQHFVTAFRSVSNRFVFEWNVNMGNNTSTQMNPETAYPGDQYVDFIGMDFYWNTQWDPKDPDQAWTSMRDRPYGLAWHQTFAAAHGKPTTYSEWGIMSDDAGPYIANAKKWFDDHAVVFHTYWDSNSAFQGKLSGGQYPKAAAAYISAFGP